jgi:transcription elongation factor
LPSTQPCIIFYPLHYELTTGFALVNSALNSAATVGVIYKVERGFARVLDQSGMTREVEPHLITQKRDSSRAIATDAEGNSIQDGDSVREMTGAVSSYE